VAKAPGAGLDTIVDYYVLLVYSITLCSAVPAAAPVRRLTLQASAVMDYPKPPYLLKLPPGPSLAPGGVVLVVDPRAPKSHYVSCGACCPGRTMSLSTYVQKHHVHSGGNCLKEGRGQDLPEGSQYIELQDITGWIPVDKENGDTELPRGDSGGIGASDGGTGASGDEPGLREEHGRDTETLPLREDLMKIPFNKLKKMVKLQGSHIGVTKLQVIDQLVEIRQAATGEL